VSLFSVIGAMIVWYYLPPTEHQIQVRITWSEMAHLCFRPNVLASILVAMFLFVTVDCFITIWGIWLTADYGLDAATLGLVATGIGFAELIGSGSSSLFIDRIGKRRGSELGLLMSGIILLFIPLTRSSFPMAVATLILTGTFLEFTIVSLMPLYSEQAPEARATLFSLILLGSAIGGALGAPIAATLWEATGLWGVCIVAAGCLLVALSLMRNYMREEAISLSHLDF
jgi:predicted MFS family arabinose efflux permease